MACGGLKPNNVKVCLVSAPIPRFSVGILEKSGNNLAMNLAALSVGVGARCLGEKGTADEKRLFGPCWCITVYEIPLLVSATIY